MASYNKVILMGNLTRDPQASFLPSGTAVTEFSLAVNRRWKDAQGNPREEVLFIDCSAFGKPAETLAKYLKKGKPVHVEGHLKLDAWEAQDGSKRSKIRVIVAAFRFVDSGRAEPPVEDSAPAATPPAAPVSRSRPAARNRRRDAKEDKSAQPVATADAAPAHEDIPI